MVRHTGNMRLPDGAVNRARAVFAAVGPVPDDAVIIRAIEAALRQPDVAPRRLPPGTPLRYLTRQEIMQVPCPLCHAESGNPCSQGHKPRAHVHVERQERALVTLPEQDGEAERAAYFAGKASTSS